MQRFLRVVFILLLASISILAQAELYSWVDKNGKKHYGDKIPQEYAKQAQTVDVKKANTMQKPPKVKIYQAPHVQQNNEQNNNTENERTPYDLSTCEAQKRAYEDSQQCYNQCRLQPDGRPVNNVSACTQCQDVKKPNCH